MKTFKIKNYKGNLVESLSKFQESHKDMKIVEAVEEGDTLKISVNEAASPYDGEHVRYMELPTINQLTDWLEKFRKTYPDLRDNTIYVLFGKRNGLDVAEPYVFDDNGNEVSLGVLISKFTT